MPIVGDVVADRYRIDAVLGHGGMATVFRARDLRLDRDVAVKVLAANLAADAAFAARFDREARTMAGFTHPGLVAVYDVEPGDPLTGREPLYVMEFCPDGSLADRIAADGPIPAQDLVPAIGAVAEGLDELHAAGFIHRDVKPHNILFAGGRAKLGDFGVAKGEPSEPDLSLTLPGSLVGTRAFLAPELLAGGPASIASDVYALGVTAFLGLTGRYPETAAESVSAIAPELGTAFDATLARALDPDPGVRPSPQVFANELAVAAERGFVGAEATVADAPAGVATAVDPDAQTIVAGPVDAAPVDAAPVQPLPLERPKPAPGPTVGALERPSRPSRMAVVIAAVVLLVVGAIAATSLLRVGPGASPTPAVRATSASPSGAQPVLAALDRVDAAIEAARGGKDRLNGKDANELGQLAGSVRSAVQRNDLGAARTAARSLADRAVALGTRLDADRRQALLDAVDALVKAV